MKYYILLFYISYKKKNTYIYIYIYIYIYGLPKINSWLCHCWFVPCKIPGYFSSFGEFRCVSAVNLFRAGTRWMSFFFFFGTYTSLSLECWMTMIVQISACWIIPHFFFLLSTDQTVQVYHPFSSCFHFSEQLPIFSTSLKDRVPFYFKRVRQVFIFWSKGWTYWDLHLDRAYFLSFFKASDGSCAVTVLHLTHRYLWCNLY